MTPGVEFKLEILQGLEFIVMASHKQSANKHHHHGSRWSGWYSQLEEKTTKNTINHAGRVIDPKAQDAFPQKALCANKSYKAEAPRNAEP